jgi:hypothetical protein
VLDFDANIVCMKQKNERGEVSETEEANKKEKRMDPNVHLSSRGGSDDAIVFGKASTARNVSMQNERW